jgi:nucleoside permease NupC
MAIGGMIGAVIAAFITQYSNPKYCFLASTLSCFALCIFAFRMNPEIEKETISSDD